MSLVVALGVVILVAEASLNRRSQKARSATVRPATDSPGAPRATVPALAALALLVLDLGAFPDRGHLYWLTRRLDHCCARHLGRGSAPCAGATTATLAPAVAAGVATMLAALPMAALLAVRHQNPAVACWCPERSTYLVQSLPGTGWWSAQPGVLRRPLLPAGVPVARAAHRLVRDPLLPAGADLRRRVRGPGAGPPGRCRTIARARPGSRCSPR